MKPASEQEENEVVILHLRLLCETKQKSHLHIGEGPQVTTDRQTDRVQTDRVQTDRVQGVGVWRESLMNQ